VFDESHEAAVARLMTSPDPFPQIFLNDAFFDPSFRRKSFWPNKLPLIVFDNLHPELGFNFQNANWNSTYESLYHPINFNQSYFWTKLCHKLYTKII